MNVSAYFKTENGNPLEFEGVLFGGYLGKNPVSDDDVNAFVDSLEELGHSISLDYRDHDDYGDGEITLEGYTVN